MRNVRATGTSSGAAGTAAKIAVALLALAGIFAATACHSPKVFNYGNGDPNITVDQG